ncbi:MAG TPA: CotH kinase family protein [Polyangia bacterium]
MPSRNVNSWFPKLMTDPTFVAQVKTRWKALRGNLLSQAAHEQRITMLTGQLETMAVARDFAKWPVSSVLPNGHSGIVYGPSVATWDGQVQAMHDFLIARANWMDTQWQ